MCIRDSFGGGFCYSVISSWRYTPPRASCEPEVCVFPLRAVSSLVRSWCWFILFFFSSFPFFWFFRFRFGHSLFHPVSFLCGYYAVSSVSVSAATRLAYDMYIYILRSMYLDTYADFTFLVLSEVYDLFHLLCIISCFFVCVPTEVVFRSRVIGACPVTTECIVAMS